MDFPVSTERNFRSLTTSSSIAEKKYLDVAKEYKTTLGELIEKYKENFQHQPGFHGNKAFWLTKYADHFGQDTRLSNIRFIDVETYQNRLRKTLTRSGTVRKVSSINREMSCLRHMFRKAVEWDMASKSPFDCGKSLVDKEDNKRFRYLTEEEIERLLNECKRQLHLHRIVVCALNTGMRRGEILSLRWNQIRNGFI